MKNFIQDGKTIEYKVADTAIKSGAVSYTHLTLPTKA